MNIVNFEKNYTVYLHINKLNNMTYVGATKLKPKRRWNNGNGYKTQTVFYNAIQEYGWDNFEHIILFKNKTKQEAEELEILFIKILMSNNKIYGYNRENGGNSAEKITNEIKLKMSKSQKGNQNGRRNIICNGESFDSIKDCASYLGIARRKLNDWLLNPHRMPQEYINLGLRYCHDYDYRITKGRMVVCDDVVFDSIKKCSVFYNIKYGTMWGWLNGISNMKKEFKNLGLRYYDGELNNNSKIE